LLFLFVQLAKSVRDVSKFASIGLIDADAPEIQSYIKYFDISLIPATIFFFNAHHMKMDSGYASPCSKIFFPYERASTWTCISFPL
jgi:hypothetical protein